MPSNWPRHTAHSFPTLCSALVPATVWIALTLGVSGRALLGTGVGGLAYFLTTFFGIIPGAFAFAYAGHAGAAVATGSGNRLSLILTAAGVVLVSAYVARIATRAIRRAGVNDA